MIAKLAYLTSPGEGRYVFNYQPFGADEVTSVELDPDQMRNILSTGVPLMLRSSLHRVPIAIERQRDESTSQSV